MVKEVDKIDKNEGSICQFDLYHGDCIEFMSGMGENSVDFTLTDIPYGVVNNYGSAGDEKAIRKLNKGAADIVTFTLDEFLPLIHKVTGNSVCVFCGKEQFSQIFDYFASQAGTTRAIVWDKTNPSPLGGQYSYLSGIEMAVWFKKKGAKVFNAHCKNSVFRHPCGRSKLHPTEKNHALLKDLILDNTNEGDTVFDPCAGSGAHMLVALENGRNTLGCEIKYEYYEIAKERLESASSTQQIGMLDLA